MARKRFIEHWRDTQVKTPVLSWILDRKAIYVAALTVALAGAGILASSGWDSYQRILTPLEEVSPWRDMTSVPSPGVSWASSYVSAAPPSISGWSASKTTSPRHPFDRAKCSGMGEVPANVLGTASGSGSGAEVRVLVTSAGEGRTIFNSYLSKDCLSGAESAWNGDAVVFDGGFLMTAGDAVVGVTTPDNTSRDILFEHYTSNMRDSLTVSGCVSTAVSESDRQRNAYTAAGDFTGLIKIHPVSTNVDIGGLPEPVIPELLDVSGADRNQPEGPLPATLALMPEPVSRPELPPNPGEQEKDSFDVAASYRIVDRSGPGCGWAWSGYTMPVHDFEKLAADEEAALGDAQNSSDEKASAYVNERMAWAFGATMLLPEIERWNGYVLTVSEVNDEWDWLESERAKLYQPWRVYVDAMDDWSTFDARKQTATDKYLAAVAQCEADDATLGEWEELWLEPYLQQQAELDAWRDREADRVESDHERREVWEQEYAEWQERQAERDSEEQPSATPSPNPSATSSPTPSPTPSTSVTPTPSPTQTVPVSDPEPEPFQPTTPEPAPVGDPIPAMPTGCVEVPQPEPIMSQDKPAQPIAPEIPTGVTIPASWPQP